MENSNGSINGNGKKANHESLSVDEIESTEYNDMPKTESVFGGNRTLVLSSGKNYEVSVAKDETFVFDLPVVPMYFIPSRTGIRVTAEIRSADGKKLGSGEKVAPIDGILDNLISRVDVFSHGKLVHNWNYCGITTYVNTLLSFPQSYIESSLAEMRGYIPDNGIFIDDRTEADRIQNGEDPYNSSWDNNDGLKRRRNIWSLTENCELCGELHLPILSHDRLLPLMAGWRFEFGLNSNAYCLMQAWGSEAAQLVITSFELLIDLVELRAPAQATIEKPLKSKKGELSVAFQNLETTVINLLAGTTQFSTQSFIDQPARQFIVFFLDEEALRGSLRKTPTKFEHFFLNKLELDVGGQVQFYEQNYEKGHWRNSYRKVLAVISGDPLDTALSGDHWSRFPIYCFDSTPGLNCNDIDMVPESWNKMMSWAIRGEFQVSLATNVSMVIIREVDRTLTFDTNFVASIS